MPKIHRDYDNNTFLGKLIDRASARRKWENTENDDRRSFVERRNQYILCYAYSTYSDNYYVGYNSIAGGMYGNRGFLGNQEQNLGVAGKITDRDLPFRRLDRLIDDRGPFAYSDPGMLGRPIANCAEACAYSIALSYDERLRDLFFIAFHPSEGEHRQVNGQDGARPKPPCGNCNTWLQDSFGYWENGFVFP